MCLRVCVCVFACVSGLIQRENGSMEKELEELRRSRPKPPVGGDFTLSDCFYFTRQGIESIVDDEVHFFLLTHLQTLVLILKWKCFSHVCQLSILKSGDPAVHFWGAGVLELTDSHQQWFPVHKSEADAGLWPWHHCEILHPCPPQVEKYCRVHPPQIYSFLHREAMWKTESRLTWLC